MVASSRLVEDKGGFCGVVCVSADVRGGVSFLSEGERGGEKEEVDSLVALADARSGLVVFTGGVVAVELGTEGEALAEGRAGC